MDNESKEQSIGVTASPETSKAHKQEKYFLEGPHSRQNELLYAIRIFKEFIKGFRAFHFIGPCVTVFGSARFKSDHRFYKIGQEMGKHLVNLGFTVMTGGGPGVMEAVNRGAKEAGGRSVGCNIKLPREEEPNAYLDKWVTFDYFFVRKTLLIKYSYAFIGMPGGFGTIDELFEVMTLIQTKKVQDFPVVLIGKEFYAPLTEQMNLMLKEGTISETDLKLIMITDDVNEAIEHIQKFSIEKFGLVKKPWRLLGEKGRGTIF